MSIDRPVAGLGPESGDALPHPQRGRRARTGFEIVALIVGLLVVLAALLAFGLYFVALGENERAANPGAAEPLLVPAADINVRLVPGAGQVRDLASLPRSVSPDLFQEVVPGTLMHVATAQIAGDRTYMFAWREAGDGEGLRFCDGVFGESGGGSGCGHEDELDGGPRVQWGSGSNGFDSADNVSVSRAPNEARWMVVETNERVRIASNIVASSGYAQWDSRFGAPVSVTLLDAQLRTVWSMPIG